MKIAVIFVGLIVHVNQMGIVNSAVMPWAPHHEPVLRIPIGAIIDQNELNGLDASMEEGHWSIPLRSLVVRLRRTSGLSSDLKPEYKSAVASLGKVVKSAGSAPVQHSIRHEVRNRLYVREDLDAYFDYHGGELTPESYLRFKLSFDGSETETPFCAVCGARYDANADGGYVKLIFRRHGVTIAEVRVRGGKEDATRIEVRNTPPEWTPLECNERPGHSRFLSAVLERKPEIDVKIHCDLKCDRPCSNVEHEGQRSMTSNYVLVPGDDCTIVRYP